MAATQLDILVRVSDQALNGLKRNLEETGTAGEVAGTKTSGFGGKLATLAKVGAIAGVAIGATALVVGKQLVEAAITAQEETGKLSKALDNQGISYDKVKPQIDAAEASQRKLGFTNADTRESLTKLVQAGESVTQANNDMGIASDLARAKGISLGDATTALIKIHTGNTKALKEFGIVIPPVTDAQDKLKASGIDLTTVEGKHELALAKVEDKLATGAVATDILAGKVKGQADEFSKSAAGGMEAFHAQLGNIEEVIGAKLLPIVTKLMSYMSDLLGWFTNGQSVTDHFRDVLDKLGISGETSTRIIHGIGVAVEDAKAVISTAITIVTAIWDKFGNTIMTVVKNDFGALTQIISGVFQVIEGLFNFFNDLIHGRWSKLWGDVQQIFTGAWKIISGEAEMLWNHLVAIASAAWALIGDAVTNGINNVIGFMSALPGKILNAIGDLGALLFDAGKAVVQGLIDGIESKAEEVYGKLKDLANKAKSVVTSVLGIFSPSTVFHEIGQNISKGLAAGVADGQTEVTNKMTDLSNKAIQAFEAGTNAGLAKMQSDFDAKIADVITRPMATAMAKVDQLNTEALAKISALGAAMTPAEQQLANLQAAHDAAGRADALSSAQGTLATDTASGATADQLAADQRTINDALYAIKVAALEKTATLQRQKRDEEVAAQTAHQSTIYANEQKSLTDTYNAKQASFTKIHNKQVLDYQSERTLQEDHLKVMLADLGTQLAKHPEMWNADHAKIMALFKDSFGPDFITSGKNLGLGFAKGLEQSFDAVQAASSKLAQIVSDHLPHSPAKTGPLSVLPNWDALLPSFGSPVQSMTSLGNSILGSGVARGGGGNPIVINVAGSVISERDLVDVVYRGLLQKGVNNPLALPA